MGLESFLLESTQSHAREEILNHKLLFDLKVAAAEADYHLQNYFSDVDHEGFDVILDDGVNLRKIQLKTVGKNSATAKWDIHRGLLRPMANNLEALGFQYTSPQFDDGRICWGAEGAVIVIEYEVNGSEIATTYRYSDVYVVTAISLGLLNRPAPTVGVANTLREQLPQGDARSKVEVKKGVLVEAATPMHLLCLAGMESSIKRNWQMRVRSLANEEWGEKGQVMKATLDQYRSEFLSVMEEVCGRSSP